MPGPFPYQRGFGSTPAPICDITVSWEGRTLTVPALIDSGASGTVIPDSLVTPLSLRKIREIPVTGVEGRRELRSMYVVDIGFLGFQFPSHPVIGIPRRTFALIGRDILNRHTATLRGRTLEFSVE